MAHWALKVSKWGNRDWLRTSDMGRNRQLSLLLCREQPSEYVAPFVNEVGLRVVNQRDVATSVKSLILMACLAVLQYPTH